MLRIKLLCVSFRGYKRFGISVESYALKTIRIKDEASFGRKELALQMYYLHHCLLLKLTIQAPDLDMSRRHFKMFHISEEKKNVLNVFCMDTINMKCQTFLSQKT